MTTLNPPPRRIPELFKKDLSVNGFFTDLINSVYQIFIRLKYNEPSDIQDIVAANGITPTNRIMRVAGSGGAVTVSATPSIAAVIDGTELIVQGTSDTNTVTLQDESSLTNSTLALSGGSDFTLGLGDTIYLVYNATDSKWYEISRSNN